MKWKRTNKISFEEADALIEKYYEGFTSVEEENRLQAFLSQRGLPEKYSAEQAIFGYFDTKKKKPVFEIKPVMKWANGIAAVMVIALGLQFYSLAGTSSSYAYINGLKITDTAKVKQQAINSLSELSAENDEVDRSLENIYDNNKNLVKQQLDVFSGLGE